MGSTVHPLIKRSTGSSALAPRAEIVPSATRCRVSAYTPPHPVATCSSPVTRTGARTGSIVTQLLPLPRDRRVIDVAGMNCKPTASLPVAGLAKMVYPEMAASSANGGAATTNGTIAAAIDDWRRLGLLDLLLNHPGAVVAPSDAGHH